jgi:Cof subfamily protein (haloacid dehalogenase superfamily)
MIRLIATDLDGTLLSSHGKINEKVRDIVAKLNKNNIVFASASGRLLGTVKRNFKHINSKILFICHNGALVQYSDEDTPIFESIIDERIVPEVIAFIKSLNAEIYLCDKDHAHLNSPSKEIQEEFAKCEVSINCLDDLSMIDSNIYRIGIFRPSGFEENILNQLEFKFGSNLSFQRGGKVWLDVVNKGIDKGTSLKMIQERLNISEEETLVFGDYYNDIPMFSRAYYSYAVANAPEDVKKRANFIAPSNDENGVIQIIMSEVLRDTL